MLQLVPGQHIHLVGIGGTGLSAIARILLEQGYHITGSDRSRNAFTEALEADGAIVYEGHDPTHVIGAEMVIISSAIPRENVEVLAAHAQGIPVYKRADVMSAIMSGDVGIAIAGTHGKTTTTAMTAHILIETGRDPSYIIGGILPTTGRNAGAGRGRAFVVEADEYDNMFHGLSPQVEVITNVEYDHPDFFRSPHELTESFSHFVGLLPRDGLLVACADDPVAMIFADNRTVVDLPVATYGIHNTRAMWQARNIRHMPDNTTFDVYRHGENLGTVTLKVPGEFNVLNALAALIVADHEDVPFAEASSALSTFRGAGRRFDIRAEMDGVVIVDDYAHHPTAIHATIAAARQRYPEHEIWAVWQPHTYSRTAALQDQYQQAFTQAHHVLVTDIYAAREKPIAGITAASVASGIDNPDVHHTPSLEDAARFLVERVNAPAVILIMSAGDAPRIGELFIQWRGAHQ